MFCLSTVSRTSTAARTGKALSKKGRNLGGEIMTYGDASLRPAPLPLITRYPRPLWLEDDEVPARLDLMFDSTCDMQLPTDVIWAIAMMSVLIMR